MIENSRRDSPGVERWVLLGLCGLLLGSVVGSLTIGRYPLNAALAARIVWALLTGTGSAVSGPWTETQWVVVELVRLPRVLLATLAGASLALCGAALQGLFRNPLVGPEVTGVTAGASLGAVIGILLSLPVALTLGSAFAGGMVALGAAYILARLSGGASTFALLLAGVIVSAFFAACVGMAEFLADPQAKLPNILYFLLGSFVDADWRKTLILAAALGIPGSLLLGLRWRINLLSLGDLDAAVLGERVDLLRWVVVTLVSLIIAAQVAVSGGVGWIGLIIPHLARMLIGPDHRVLLPAAALLGGTSLLLMDDLARTLTRQEVPIGLVTAVVGTPIFAYVFWKSRAGGWTRD